MDLISRRSLLVLAGAGAAGAAINWLLPGSAQSALGAGPALPIPALIEARDGQPVTLALQTGRHSFGVGPEVATTGISSGYLGPVVRVRSGDTIPFRVENRLAEESTLHWHGMLIPSSVDGGPHNSIRAGGVWQPALAVRQPAATLWFHPHPHGRTGRQVYSGMAGMMIVTDGADRDLGLPNTYGVDDLPLVLQDKRFARDGQLVYAADMMTLMDGMRGDTLLVNGVAGPTARVPAGFVRLRVLNAANARNFDLRFSDGRPFYVIGGDAGLLPAPVELTGLVMAPAERYEILVDFTNRKPVDLLTGADQHSGGMMGMMGGGSAAGPLLRFQPDAALPVAVARLPRVLVASAAPDAKSAVTRRKFTLDPVMGPGMMGGRPVSSESGLPQVLSINGRPFGMDRVDATAKLGTSEIWEIVASDMAHPFHMHGVSFRILTKDGAAPPAQEAGWKDVVLVQKRAELLVNFTQPAASHQPFMFHCHILEHEDQGMMGQFAVV